MEIEASSARSPTLLGRAERSSPKAAQRRAAGAGLDGEGGVVKSRRIAGRPAQHSSADSGLRHGPGGDDQRSRDLRQLSRPAIR